MWLYIPTDFNRYVIGSPVPFDTEEEAKEYAARNFAIQPHFIIKSNINNPAITGMMIQEEDVVTYKQGKLKDWVIERLAKFPAIRPELPEYYKEIGDQIFEIESQDDKKYQIRLSQDSSYYEVLEEHIEILD